MRVEHFFIGLVIFLTVMTMGFLIYSEMIINYGIDGDESVLTVKLRNLTQAQQIEQSLRQDVQLQEASEDDTESSFYKSQIPATLNVFQTAELAGETLEETARKTRLVPPFLIDNLLLILGIMAAVFALYMFFRFKPPND